MICEAGRAGKKIREYPARALPCHTPPMNRKLQGTVHMVIDETMLKLTRIRLNSAPGHPCETTEVSWLPWHNQS